MTQTNYDVKERYNKLEKDGLLDDRWDAIAYSSMEVENKFVVAIMRWMTAPTPVLTSAISPRRS